MVFVSWLKQMNLNLLKYLHRSNSSRRKNVSMTKTKTKQPFFYPGTTLKQHYPPQLSSPPPIQSLRTFICPISSFRMSTDPDPDHAKQPIFALSQIHPLNLEST